jgi:hypothetical protein
MNRKKLYIASIYFVFLCFQGKTQINQGLTGYWSFNDSTYAGKDFTGNGHTGAIKGSPTNIKGIKGNALHFNGNGDYLDVPNGTGLNVGKSHSFSISLWMLIDSTETNSSIVRPLISKRIGGSDNSDYIIFTQGGNLLWGTGASSDKSAWMSIAQPSKNAWHHLVTTLRYNKSTSVFSKKVYLDTFLIKQDSGKVKADSVTNDMFIAYAVNGSSPSYFHGSLDEIRFYDRELNKIDIGQLYKSIFTSVSEEKTLQNDISVYPNPVSGSKLYLHFGENVTEILHLSLYSLSGKKILSDVSVSKEAHNFTMDINNISNGIYFLGIESKDKKEYQKIIIQR